jgi:hypothetical protein
MMSSLSPRKRPHASNLPRMRTAERGTIDAVVPVGSTMAAEREDPSASGTRLGKVDGMPRGHLFRVAVRHDT